MLTHYHIDHDAILDPSNLDIDNLKNYEIVLLDIRMPKINGIDLLKALKPKLPNSKFIALTAHSLPKQIEHLKNEGFIEVFEKPFKEDGFIKMILRNMDYSEAEAASIIKSISNNFNPLAIFDVDLIDSFIDESTNDLEALGIAILNHHYESIYELIHKLGGRLGQLGFSELSSQLKDLERRMIKNGELKAADFDMLLSIKNKISEVINDLAASHKNSTSVIN